MSYEDETLPLEKVKQEAIAHFVKAVSDRIQAATEALEQTGQSSTIYLTPLTAWDLEGISAIERTLDLNDLSEVKAHEHGLNVAGKTYILERYQRNTARRGLLIKEVKVITVPTHTQLQPQTIAELWAQATYHDYAIHLFGNNTQIFGDPFEYPQGEIKNAVLRKIRDSLTR